MKRIYILFFDSGFSMHTSKKKALRAVEERLENPRVNGFKFNYQRLCEALPKANPIGKVTIKGEDDRSASIVMAPLNYDVLVTIPGEE